MTIDDIAVWMGSVLSGLATVVISPSNAPRPAGDYVTIQDITEVGELFPEVHKSLDDEDTIRFESFDHTRETFSVQAYSVNGKALLRKIKLAANMPPDIGRPCLVDVGDIRDLTFLDDTRHAPRFQQDMTFSHVYAQSTTDPRVRSWTANGKITAAAGDVDVEVSGGN